MGMQQNVYNWGLATALIFTATDPACAANFALSSLPSYLLASSVAAEPGLLVILGVALIGLRVVISRRGRRSQKDPV